MTIARALTSVTYPAEIMLVAALNPCLCGYYTDSRRECHCTPTQIQNYMAKISGPLLDRIDIHIEVSSVQYRDLKGAPRGEASADIRGRVTSARAVQSDRYRGRKPFVNARISNQQIKTHCVLDSQAESLLQQAMTELALSARAYNKILKVARTIADLDGSESLRIEHVSEAIQYRSLDRGLWQ